jgi:uncharacterized protein
MKLIGNVGAMMNRAIMAARAGMQFGNKRNLYEVFGYNKAPRYEDLYAIYLRQDIASRVVDAPATAIWSRPPAVTGNDEFNAKWQKLLQEQQLWSLFDRLDKLAGIGKYATLLIGVDDIQSTQDLAKPVAPNSDARILYLQPYGESSAQINKFSADVTSAKYALPELYNLSPNDPASVVTGRTSQMQKLTLLAHESRVLHVAEGGLEDNIFGLPRLEKVFNLFTDLAKVVGGTAETYWLTANRGMQINIDKDLELSEDDAAALSDELDEFQHQLRRYVRTRGVEMKPLGTDTPDPEKTFNMLIALISGTTGIPKRILIGSEAGQLASEQDRANWADRIDERRTMFAEPVILRPFIMKLQEMQLLPMCEVTIVWPDAYTLSPLERGQSRAQEARAAVNLQRALTDANKESLDPVISREEARKLLGYIDGTAA